MNEIINPELSRLLGSRTDDMELVQALMYEMWRGHRLLVPRLNDGTFLKIRLPEGVCLPAFTGRAPAQAFAAMLESRMGPPVSMDEAAIEEVLAAAIGAGALLGLNPGAVRAALIPANVLAGIRTATEKLTGGRTTAEDLRLMRLHMNTVNNAARVRAAGLCGCFHCCESFPSGEVARFMPEQGGGETALCPRCGVDAVLTNLDGEPLNDALLKEMHDRFFSGGEDLEEAGLRMMYLECMRGRLKNNG